MVSGVRGEMENTLCKCIIAYFGNLGGGDVLGGASEDTNDTALIVLNSTLKKLLVMLIFIKTPRDCIDCNNQYFNRM